MIICLCTFSSECLSVGRKSLCLEKIFAILGHLFHFPGMHGNEINIFLSKVSLNAKFQNDKVLDFENMTVKTGVAAPLGLNIACHFKGTKARYITCPRCLDSLERSHMVF